MQSSCATVRAVDAPRVHWRGIVLDELTEAELTRASFSIIALDGDGRVVATSASAARWAGVTAWQLRGRELTRELAWRLGEDATLRLVAFLNGSRASATLRVAGRRGSADADLTVLRGASRRYLVLG